MLFATLFQLFVLANVCLLVLAGSHRRNHNFSLVSKNSTTRISKTENDGHPTRSRYTSRIRWQDEIDGRSDGERSNDEKPDDGKPDDGKPNDEKPEILDEVLGLAGLPKDCGGFLLRRHGNLNQTSKGRIAGGKTAYANSIPSFAYLPGSSTGLCGGTIIHKRYIMTAAHCFKNPDGSSSFKQVGLGSIKTKDNLMLADRICVNTFYNGRVADDLAILRLPRDITFDRFTQPACLPDTEPDSEEMDNLITVGMGRMEGGELADELQMLDTKWANCQEFTRPEIICYVDRNPDRRGRVCNGDSGSGTFFLRNGRQYLMAVLSSSYDIDCRFDNRDAYAAGADVFYQRSTIDRMLKACGTWGGPPPEDRAKLRSLGFNPSDERIVFV